MEDNQAINPAIPTPVEPPDYYVGRGDSGYAIGIEKTKDAYGGFHIHTEDIDGHRTTTDSGEKGMTESEANSVIAEFLERLRSKGFTIEEHKYSEGQKTETPDNKERGQSETPKDEGNKETKKQEQQDPSNSDRPRNDEPQRESAGNRFSDVKENFNNARKADKAGDSELAQKYRAQAWEAFHQIQNEDSKAGVAALGASIAAPFVGAAAVAGGVAVAGTAAGKAVLGFLAKRSVQWAFTGFGVANGVRNDEEADISSVVLEGALRGILPLLSKSFKGPGTYGALAEEPLREADNLLGALNQGNLGSGITDLDEVAKLWNPIAERMRTLAVIKTDKGIYYAVRGGALEKEQIKILESFGFKSAKEELKNLGLGVVAKEGHAERQLIDLALAKGEVPKTLLISKAACGRSCHYCSYQINSSGEFGFVPQEFHPSGKAVSFKQSQRY